MSSLDRQKADRAGWPDGLSQFRLNYTLCFLTRGSRVLLLRRRNPPNQGLWNGVGGRLEPGELPLAACLREVREETGYVLATARFTGVLTWSGFEIGDGGLYLFAAPAPAGEPAACAEGELRWRQKAWMLTSPQVVGNLHLLGADVLSGQPPAWHHCDYQAGRLAAYARRPLPAGWPAWVLSGT